MNDFMIARCVITGKRTLGVYIFSLMFYLQHLCRCIPSQCNIYIYISMDDHQSPVRT